MQTCKYATKRVMTNAGACVKSTSAKLARKSEVIRQESLYSNLGMALVTAWDANVTAWFVSATPTGHHSVHPSLSNRHMR